MSLSRKTLCFAFLALQANSVSLGQLELQVTVPGSSFFLLYRWALVFIWYVHLIYDVAQSRISVRKQASRHIIESQRRDLRTLAFCWLCTRTLQEFSWGCTISCTNPGVPATCTEFTAWGVGTGRFRAITISSDRMECMTLSTRRMGWGGSSTRERSPTGSLWVTA